LNPFIMDSETMPNKNVHSGKFGQSSKDQNKLQNQKNPTKNSGDV